MSLKYVKTYLSKNNKGIYFTGYSLNKETSNKNCRLNDFRGFIAIHIFKRHQVLLNFYQKQAIRNFSDCFTRLPLILVIRIYFDKSLIYNCITQCIVFPNCRIKVKIAKRFCIFLKS